MKQQPYINNILKYLLIIILIIIFSGCLSKKISSVNLENYDISIKNRLMECIGYRDIEDRESCIMHVADDYRIPELCDTIYTEYYKNWCFKRLGEKMNNRTLCEKISTKNEKNFCIAVVLSEPYYCKKIEDDDIHRLCRRRISQTK